MKYAIYDKAAEGYLTSMEFNTEVPGTEVTFSCGYNEYITEAKLLDTPKEATDAIVRIGRLKFVDKGRFVMHSFDDTFKDQYIISEAGNPTKVVDNITVDLDGNINVKYGTMISHWSATSIEYAVNRMNALQKAKSPKYAAWCNTFDIYKVIKAIDEKGFVNYQFIKVTDNGLTEYAKEEVDPLNKRIDELEKANAMLVDNVNYNNECRVALADMIRAIKYAICSRVSDKRVNYISYMTDKIKDDEIFNRPELKTTKNDIPKICKHLTSFTTDSLNKCIEELEKANYELGVQVTARGVTANRLHEENDDLKNKVESIKKEARNWKKLYENADADKKELKNVIDVIYDDLKSETICDDLKDTLNALEHNSGLEHICMPTKASYILDNGNWLTAKDEICTIIDQIITIMDSRELNQNVAFSAEGDLHLARGLAADIIDICEANDEFDITLKKFSELYEAINAMHNCDNDSILYTFKSVLLIFSKINSNLENVVSENVVWKNKAQKAAKDLDDQKKLNDANKATIARMVVEKHAMDKELSDAADALNEVNDKNDALSDMLRETTDSVADIMLATRTIDNDKMISDLTDVSLKIGVKTVDDGPIYGISVILNILIRKIKEATEWKARTEEAICKCKTKDADYETLKNKLEACEVILDSTHDLLIKTIKEKDKAMDYCINDVGLTKEIQKYTSIRDALAEVIYAIRNAIFNRNSDAFNCIESRMKNDSDFNSDPFMAGIRENIIDICTAEKKNIANNDLKNSEIARLANKNDKRKEILELRADISRLLKEKEMYKRIANSVYGIGIPSRCNGKQAFCDIATGKKILIDKEKYDDLMECVNNISLTYEMMKLTPFSMDRPSWLSGIINRINNLTK